MASTYSIEDTSRIISPGLVVFYETMQDNLQEMIRIAGGVERLRPHCKTHKMREVAELQVQAGIIKHKCATFAEAEMLVSAGVRDIFLAYNLVGPNIHRAVEFQRRYPDVTFSVTADHPTPIAQLGQAMTDAGQQIDVLLDLDTGQHRTGIAVDENAFEIYRLLHETDGIRAGGLHVYDGQNHQTDLQERQEAVDAVWESATGLASRLREAGLPVPRIVAGGTGSFPVYAQKEDAALELSPGTCVFFDCGYGRMFPDLNFEPAARILTRVISRPTNDRITVDLGYKACASDPPAGNRLLFPDLEDAKEVLQNEEHLVLETDRANEFSPGDELLAIPRHICPTSALHRQVYVVRDNKLWQEWEVAARDRWINV